MNFSVLLSIYYKENTIYFKQALDSVFSQTKIPSEIILVKDGPLTTELNELIEKYQEKYPYFKVISLKQNRGLSYALNEGLKHCSYEYVARMDTDDICRSDRFEKQQKYLAEHPEIDVLGTYAMKINNERKQLGLLKVPTDENVIHKLIWACPFIHPSVMFRKSKILSVGGYNPDSGPRQDDYELWFRCAEGGLRFSNLPEALLLYRFSEKNITKNSLNVGWHRFKVGFSGNRKMKYGFKAYIGISIPFLRSLLPYPLNIYFYKFTSKFNPRDK